MPELDRHLTGHTFSHVLGSRFSPLELFVLKRKLMGPCWLTIHNATPAKFKVCILPVCLCDLVHGTYSASFRFRAVVQSSLWTIQRALWCLPLRLPLLPSPFFPLPFEQGLDHEKQPNSCASLVLFTETVLFVDVPAALFHLSFSGSTSFLDAVAQ